MISNFILLTGPDDFRRSTRQRFLMDGFKKKYPEGEITRFEENHTFNDLQNTVLTPNLFASRRLILTTSFWNSENFEKSEKRNFWETLTSQQDTVTLVSVEPSLDKRTKVAKKLEERAKVENYDLLATPKLRQWLIQTAQQKGGTLKQTEAEYLINRCGINGWNLYSEIEKLCLASTSGNINRALIDSLTMPHPTVVVWEFLRALSKQRAQSALESFKQLLESGQSGHMVFSMIIREFRIHVQLKAGSDANLDINTLASRMKMDPKLVQKNLPLSQKFSFKQLANLYNQLLSIDRRLKTGGLSVSTDDASELELAIEKFIIASCKA